MRCQVSSKTKHQVLISKEIGYKSYNEICSGEPKMKVNLGYVRVVNEYEVDGVPTVIEEFEVVNNSLKLIPKEHMNRHIRGEYSSMIYDCYVLATFFSLHGIEPNWLQCIDDKGNRDPGRYNATSGRWTGCIGKV